MSALADASAVAPEVGESSVQDLEIQRFLLDLALQPADRFDGFTVIEQFKEASLRYQLNYIAFALAMAQYTRTPAFSGYLAEAQRSLIDKMLDRQVWEYWALMNLVGNLRWDPDPIARDNVMYSGYLGVMIGLYETLNGDRRYGLPGALTLRWSRRRSYAYDFASVAEAIRRNMLRSSTTQYCCEPHLVYPICNTFALNTLLMHDRLRATELTGDLVRRVRESYAREGFLRADGRFVPGRHQLGMTLPPVLANDALMAYWLHGAMPGLAERTWRVVRERLLRLTGDRIILRIAPWERLDVGNYSLGDTMTRVFTFLAAREMGDGDVASALQRSIDEEQQVVRSGARRYTGVSTLTNAAHALARFTRRGAMRDLIHGWVPAAWRTGPLLSATADPDALVARAVTDGEALDLVLRPASRPHRTTLAFARMVPGRAYRLSGAVPDGLVADADGTAVVDVDLRDRVEVRLWPAR
jgi:linalool dehydratase/isomerase-like protein